MNEIREDEEPPGSPVDLPMTLDEVVALRAQAAAAGVDFDLYIVAILRRAIRGELRGGLPGPGHNGGYGSGRC